jgi:hypothetical protein
MIQETNTTNSFDPQSVKKETIDMTVFANLATIVAALLAIMMTFVSWRVLRGNPVLDNPVIHVAVGVLTFIGLRYRPGGLIGVILLSYEAVAVSIAFLLLLMAFRKVGRSTLVEKIRKHLQEYRQEARFKQEGTVDEYRNTSHRIRENRPQRENKSLL